MVVIEEVKTKKQLKSFVELPTRMYHDNPFYIPNTYDDDMQDWNEELNPAFEYCDAKCWLAFRDGEIVGRIGAILSHRANEKWNTNRMRFSQVDFIDDTEVADALFETVENWAVYLDKVAAEYQGPIIVSGHSKGGNLAVYAAASVRKETQDRIRKVISYDGPGFMDCLLKSSGYSAIESKVTTFVPKSSIVGMLMHHAGDLEIVECQKDGPGAHDILMWNVNAFGLERSDILAKKSYVFHQAVNQTLDSMDVTERQELIDEIFEVLTCTGAFQLTDYTEHSVANAVKMADKFNKSKEIKQFLLLLSKLSIKGAVSSIGKGKEFGEDDL